MQLPKSWQQAYRMAPPNSNSTLMLCQICLKQYCKTAPSHPQDPHNPETSTPPTPLDPTLSTPSRTPHPPPLDTHTLLTQFCAQFQSLFHEQTTQSYRLTKIVGGAGSSHLILTVRDLEHHSGSDDCHSHFNIYNKQKRRKFNIPKKHKYFTKRKNKLCVKHTFREFQRNKTF